MNVKVKNLSCAARRHQVQESIRALGLEAVGFGDHEVTFARVLHESELDALDAKLKPWGMETVRAGSHSLVDQIKAIVKTLVEQCVDEKRDCLSDVLCKQLRYNYSYLSDLFSKSEGKTIREFGIEVRIGRAKELLRDGNKDLLEISVLLNYCSVAHLAAQFKKVTGMTTTEYRRRAAEEYRAAMHPRSAMA